MDRAPADTVAAAEEALARLEPPIATERLRLRQVGGRAFVDVVIGVSPGAAVGQGHAAADRVEAALHRALPDSDVVVHVEPAGAEAELRERIRAAAMTVSHVRELHNLKLIDTDDGIEASLHLKLPAELSLAEAHAIAEEVERVIARATPAVRAVHTHLEPLADRAPGQVLAHDPDEVERAVVSITGRRPRELRTLSTDSGLVVLVTLGVGPDATVERAHAEAGAVSRKIREALPGVADVVVHTEP
jgi:divalent metal cation (Fe/Co/Zn/Cd) transporter